MSDPWDKLSAGAGYDFRKPVTTSITPGGDAAGGWSAEVGVNETYGERTSVVVEVPDDSATQVKFFAGTGNVDGTSATAKHHSRRAGLERTTRGDPLFSDGTYHGALLGWRKYLIGRGTTTVHDERPIGGETIAAPAEAGTTTDISTVQGGGVEWRPGGGRTAIEVGGEFALTENYAGGGSEFNRIVVEVGGHVSLHAADMTTPPVDGSRPSDHALAWNETLGGAFAQGHALLLAQPWGWKILAQAQKDLADAGLAGNSGNNSLATMEDIRFIQGAQDFMFALGSGEGERLYLMAGGGARLLFPALQLAGALRSADVGDKTTTMVDVANIVGMGVYALHGIDTPDKRGKLDDAALADELQTAALIRLALADGLFAVGAAEGATNGTEAMRAGALSSLGISLTPDPLEAGLVARTRLTLIPYAPGSHGTRGGIQLTKDWNGSLYSEGRILSHFLAAGNAGTRAENATEPFMQNDRYTGTQQSTDVTATVGLKLGRTIIGRLGLDIAASHGTARVAAVGVSGGVDINVGDGKGFDGTIGVRVAAHVGIPHENDAEFIPMFGIVY